MNELYDLLPGLPEFDETKLKLGTLCKRGHDWFSTGQSIRQRSSGKCCQCSREKYLKDLDNNRQIARERMQNKRKSMSSNELAAYRTHATEYQHQYLAKNGRKSRSKQFSDFVIPPHFIGSGCVADDLKPFTNAGWDLTKLDQETVKESRALWFHLKSFKPAPTVAELVQHEADNAWDIEKIQFVEAGGTEEEWKKELNRRKYYFKMATDPEYVLYHRQKSKRRKAQMRDSVAIQIKGSEISRRFASFKHCCAYCGSAGDMHIEHVVPISKGGTHAIGNIVPA